MNQSTPDGAIVRPAAPAATMADLEAAVANVKDVLARMPRLPGDPTENVSAEAFQAAWLTNRVWELDKVARELAIDLARAERALGEERESHAFTLEALDLQSQEVVRLQAVIRGEHLPWYKRWLP